MIMPNAHTFREAWLSASTEMLRPLFDAADAPLPKGRAAIGFTSKGAKSSRIGECWNSIASGDAHYEIFIRPDIADPANVLGILVHELCHAALPLGSGHGPAFKRLAHKVGLTGKMKSAHPGPALTTHLVTVADDLGPLPHASLSIMQDTAPRKKQKVNLLKASCTECDYVVRVTAIHARKGPPLCGVHFTAMTVDGLDDETGEGE